MKVSAERGGGGQLTSKFHVNNARGNRIPLIFSTNHVFLKLSTISIIDQSEIHHNFTRIPQVDIKCGERKRLNDSPFPRIHAGIKS